MFFILCVSFLVVQLSILNEESDKNCILEDSISVLHFNDGYDVRKTPKFVKKFIERTESESLNLFSGDIMSPSLVSNFLKGNQFVDFLNKIKVEFAVPGNHEYDFGEEQFSIFISQLTTKWLLCNMKVKNQPEESMSNLQEYEIKTIKNIKIGVFGLIDDKWIKSSKINPKKYDYEPFDIAAKRVSKKLKEEGCSLIFVISHMGNDSDIKVLNDSNDVDMIFGGHDHIFFVKRVNDKILLKSGTDFEYFSHVNIALKDETEDGYCDDACKRFNYLLDEEFNDDQKFFKFSLPRDDEKFLHISIEKVKIVNTDEKDQESFNFIQKKIDPMITNYLTKMVKFNTKVDTRETNMGNREIAFGDYFSDLVRAYYNTELVFINSGMFKSEKLFKKNTYFRKIDLLKVFPYDRDRFITVDLTGKEIYEVIEYSFSNYPKISSSFLSVSGAEYTINSQEKKGNILVESSIIVNNEQIDLERIYKVTIPTGLQHEIFGFPTLKNKEPLNSEDERLSPVILFEKFSNLVNNEENRNEFMIFKNNFPNFQSKQIFSIKDSCSENQFETLNELDSENQNDENSLFSLSQTALQRLRFYSLADKIEEVGDQFIFSISPKTDKRLKYKRKNKII